MRLTCTVSLHVAIHHHVKYQNYNNKGKKFHQCHPVISSFIVFIVAAFACL